MTTARLWGVGVGPGDPELITLKAHRVIRDSPVVAWFAATGRVSNARKIVETHLRPGQRELPLIYPVTTETLPAGVVYEDLLTTFYDQSAQRIAALLDEGDDVAVLCEGDPFFYGSYMYLHNRLADRYDQQVVPGVPGMLAGASVLGTPLVCLNEMLSVLSGVLPAEELHRRLCQSEAIVIMKLGRHLTKVRDCVTRAGLLERAWYVERATMEAELILPLAQADPHRAPYFSMVVIPSSAAAKR